MAVVVIKFDKLTDECRRCVRLTYNEGSCGGRNSFINNCLAFKAQKDTKGNTDILKERMINK